MSNTQEAKKPVDPHTDNPGLNSEVHAATANQSSVKPEDYPASERDAQAAIVGKNNEPKHKS